jgi:hypothetical protein
MMMALESGSPGPGPSQILAHGGQIRPEAIRRRAERKTREGEFRAFKKCGLMLAVRRA